MDGLIIKSPYTEWILSGEKSIELRGTNTNKRGRIAIIESGTKLIVGTVEIVDTMLIQTVDQYEKLRPRHCVGAERRNIKYKELWGYVLKDPIRLEKPIEYLYKKGQQVWVKDAIKIEEECR